MGKLSFREIVMKLLFLLPERRKLISLTRAHRKESQWTKEIWSFWPNYMPWISGWNPWRRSKETWEWWTKVYNLCSEQWRRKINRSWRNSRASMIIETPPVPRLEGNRTEWTKQSVICPKRLRLWRKATEKWTSQMQNYLRSWCRSLTDYCLSKDMVLLSLFFHVIQYFEFH